MIEMLKGRDFCDENYSTIYNLLQDKSYLVEWIRIKFFVIVSEDEKYHYISEQKNSLGH